MGSGIPPPGTTTTSSNNDHFCLRWHDYQNNITSAFNDIRNEENFLDVSLVTGDGSTVKAHQLVLSACSPIFKQMLNNHNHPNPLIFLSGVNSRDISAIINFMYHGQVEVNHSELNRFLSVAEELRIRGLTDQDRPLSPPIMKRARRHSDNDDEGNGNNTGGGGGGPPNGDDGKNDDGNNGRHDQDKSNNKRSRSCDSDKTEISDTSQISSHHHHHHQSSSSSHHPYHHQPPHPTPPPSHLHSNPYVGNPVHTPSSSSSHPPPPSSHHQMMSDSGSLSGNLASPSESVGSNSMQPQVKFEPKDYLETNSYGGAESPSSNYYYPPRSSSGFRPESSAATLLASGFDKGHPVATHFSALSPANLYGGGGGGGGSNSNVNNGSSLDSGPPGASNNTSNVAPPPIPPGSGGGIPVGGGRVQCPVCHKVLKNTHSVSVHISRYHGKRSNESIGEVLCPVCHRTYGNKYSLRTHMHMNHKDKLHLIGNAKKGVRPSVNLDPNNAVLHAAESSPVLPPHSTAADQLQHQQLYPHPPPTPQSSHIPSENSSTTSSIGGNSNPLNAVNNINANVAAAAVAMSNYLEQHHQNVVNNHHNLSTY